MGYKVGTINGMKLSSKGKKVVKKSQWRDDYHSLVKILIGCVIILILVFVVNAIVQANFTFNGIMYSEPEENEVIEIVSSSNEKESAERVSLSLKGDLVVKLNVGDKFVDPGFTATSDLNGDLRDFVLISGKVDTNTVGTYKITYTLSYRGISPKLTRLVKVSAKNLATSSTPSPKPSSSPSSSPTPSVTPSPKPTTSPVPTPSPTPEVTPPAIQENITLTLNGDATVYLIEGETYNELGARAVTSSGKDVSNNIKISGSVNNNVAGAYTLAYSITNYNGKQLVVVRNVFVQNMDIKLTLDNSNYTNSSVNIIINVNVDNFNNIVLPSGEKVYTTSAKYAVSKNGTYEFIVYNKSGAYRKASMVVKNIDKEKPRGRCVITHTSTGSVVTITAKDNVGIEKYLYSGVEYRTNKITFDHRLAANIQINVGFYDYAGNFGNANCLSPSY